MIQLLLLGATAFAALLQVGVLPTMFTQPAAAPLLPIALFAAWGLVREPSEVAPSAILAAVLVGVASEDRVGWILLALLPTAALLLGARLAPNSGVARAPVVAGIGAVLYLLTLLIGAGAGRTLVAVAPAMLASAVGTAILALVAALLLRPLRARPGGLFE